jgi:hypothetical protein
MEMGFWARYRNRTAWSHEFVYFSVVSLRHQYPRPNSLANDGMTTEYWCGRKRPWTYLICHPVIYPGRPRKTAESISLHIEFTGRRFEPNTSYVRQEDFKRKCNYFEVAWHVIAALYIGKVADCKERRLRWAAIDIVVSLCWITPRWSSCHGQQIAPASPWLRFFTILHC